MYLPYLPIEIIFRDLKNNFRSFYLVFQLTLLANFILSVCLSLSVSVCLCLSLSLSMHCNSSMNIRLLNKKTYSCIWVQYIEYIYIYNIYIYIYIYIYISKQTSMNNVLLIELNIILNLSLLSWRKRRHRPPSGFRNS